MPDGTTSHVMLCWPSNRSEIAFLNSRTNDKFSPTVEHSLSTCDGCGRDIWITPQQRDLAASPLMRTCTLCLFCGSEVHQTLQTGLTAVNVSPELRYAWRRTTA